MADNSNNRKKAFLVSVLAFLLIGGGVFLFFIIQGSNDLTASKNKKFEFGSAAREEVSSFFKSLGFTADETEAAAKYKDKVETSKDIKLEASTGMSDWMNKPAASAASSGPGSPRGHTSVPTMGGGSLSGAGGGGGGGSSSSGGASRFGEGSGAGNTSIKAASGGSGGPVGKGAMASLTGAKALLGEGLRSGSAMTAKGKWDSSFGVGSGSKGGNEMSYAGKGLVALDGIKKGEIGNLKMADAKSLKVPDAGKFQEDKGAESKDPTLQAAKDKASDDAKKAAAQSLAQAAAQGLSGASGTANDPKASGTTRSGGDTPAASGGEKPPDTIMAAVKGAALFQKTDMGGGESYQDTKADITKDAHGDWNVNYTGTYTTSDGQTMPLTMSGKVGLDGKIAWNDN